MQKRMKMTAKNNYNIYECKNINVRHKKNKIYLKIIKLNINHNFNKNG